MSDQLTVDDFPNFPTKAEWARVLRADPSLFHKLRLRFGREPDEAKGLPGVLCDVDISGEDVTNAFLHGVTLEGVNCEGTNFTGTDLTSVRAAGVTFAGATLTSAMLRSTHLVGAVLTGAVLDSATIRGADFRSAQVAGMRMRHAHIEDADIRGAWFDIADMPEDPRPHQPEEAQDEWDSRRAEAIETTARRWRRVEGLETVTGLPEFLAEIAASDDYKEIHGLLKAEETTASAHPG